MSKASEILAELEKSLADAKGELEIFEKGTKSACGKLRKIAQVNKKLWQDLRIEVMTTLKSMPVRPRKTPVEETTT